MTNEMTKTAAQEIRDWVEGIMDQHDWSAQDLADACDLSVDTVHKLMLAVDDAPRPSLRVLAKIQIAAGVRIPPQVLLAYRK